MNFSILNLVAKILEVASATESSTRNVERSGMVAKLLKIAPAGLTALGGEEAEELLKGSPGSIVRKYGDVDAALSSSAKTIEATYHFPFIGVSLRDWLAMSRGSPSASSCDSMAPTPTSEASVCIV